MSEFIIRPLIRHVIRLVRAPACMLMLALMLLLTLVQPPAASSQTTPPPEPTPQLRVLRVEASPAEVARLLAGGWDVLEARQGNAVFVMGDEAVQAQLAAQGFTVSVDQILSTQPQAGTQRPSTFFNGYRSVVEHAQHLDAVAAAHPDLARVVVYGQSWRKSQALPGFDLKAICITRLRPGDCALSPDTDKPRFFLMAAIHARELATAELAWRWIDLLVNSYGTDPDLTTLLDASEMWVVPIANPDGRAIVEQGGNAPYLQRKNANTTQGNCVSPPTVDNHYGVDLNRNANFQWSTAGISFNPCAQTFPGTSAASEPEQAALETLFSQLFRDQRGPGLDDAAPVTATGTLISLHSYANQVLLPWGFTFTAAPNDAGLRALAFRMSHFNQYITGTGPETLYATSGTTDDFVYGTLGVAGFTFEIGSTNGLCSGFTPNYNCVDDEFWPANREALIYAAKSARQPYATPLGPSTLTPTLSASVWQGQPVTVSVVVDDSALGNATGSYGRPTVQPISATELYIDTPPWAGGIAIPLQPADGTFDTARETARTTLNTGGLSLGRHTLFVRAQNAAGYWGPVTAQWLMVNQPYFMPIISHD